MFVIYVYSWSNVNEETERVTRLLPSGEVSLVSMDKPPVRVNEISTAVTSGLQDKVEVVRGVDQLVRDYVQFKLK